MIKTHVIIAVFATLSLASCASRSLPPGTKADRVLVEKSSRKLTLQKSGVALKSYRVALGRKPVGKKEFEGDFKTPEGLYEVTERRPEDRATEFHRGLLLSYPNAEDTANARRHGLLAGNEVLIHGVRGTLVPILGKGHLLGGDWTKGCIAVSNKEIEEIYDCVSVGTTVEIRP